MKETNQIDYGYSSLTIRNRFFSFRLPIKILTVSLILVILGVCAATAAATLGDFPITLSQVIQAIAGVGEEFHVLIVREWRLPVAIAAVVFGALLGLGGAIFQSLTRNPLGSPDIIGFDAGSYTAVVLLMLVIGTTQYWVIAAGAIVGGVITAFVVYILSWRNGVQGFRLIVVGIGVSAMLTSINSYLITRADVDDAMMVGFWSAGSINRVTWGSLTPSVAISVVIFGLALVFARSLHHMEMGDDTALTHGFKIGPARLVLIVVGVATTAFVTAAAGPIGFVALAAPQLARRITNSPGVSLLSSAAMGAALLAIAHLLSLIIATFYRPIPVGLITVSIGGCYMIWLLIQEARRYYGRIA